jgi:hypothetical protein
MKFALFALLALAACTDVGFQKVTNFAQPFHVKCFSGGQLIYEGNTTGRLENEEGSDGWAFVDAKNQQFTRVNGDCVISEN